MNDFTTKIVSCLAKGEKIDETIQELFRLELERAVNELLKIELSELLHYQKYERNGLSQTNSRKLVSFDILFLSGSDPLLDLFLEPD